VKKIKLYELSQSYLKVQDMLDNPELDNQALLDTLESIECAIEEKAHSISVIHSNLTTESKYLETEIKRLQARKKSTDGNIERIKAYLQQQMEVMKLEKIKTPIFAVTIKANPPALVIDDEKLIPAKYLTVIPKSFTPNNAEIKEALKAGKKVKGCRLTAGKRIDIR
jgi:predicted nuclease with TOPRIM domain